MSKRKRSSRTKSRKARSRSGGGRLVPKKGLDRMMSEFTSNDLSNMGIADTRHLPRDQAVQRLLDFLEKGGGTLIVSNRERYILMRFDLLSVSDDDHVTATDYLTPEELKSECERLNRKAALDQPYRYHYVTSTAPIRSTPVYILVYHRLADTSEARPDVGYIESLSFCTEHEPSEEELEQADKDFRAKHGDFYASNIISIAPMAA